MNKRYWLYLTVIAICAYFIFKQNNSVKNIPVDEPDTVFEQNKTTEKLPDPTPAFPDPSNPAPVVEENNPPAVVPVAAEGLNRAEVFKQWNACMKTQDEDSGEGQQLTMQSFENMFRSLNLNPVSKNVVMQEKEFTTAQNESRVIRIDNDLSKPQGENERVRLYKKTGNAVGFSDGNFTEVPIDEKDRNLPSDTLVSQLIADGKMTNQGTEQLISYSSHAELSVKEQNQNVLYFEFTNLESSFRCWNESAQKKTQCSCDHFSQNDFNGADPNGLPQPNENE